MKESWGAILGTLSWGGWDWSWGGDFFIVNDHPSYDSSRSIYGSGLGWMFPSSLLRISAKKTKNELLNVVESQPVVATDSEINGYWDLLFKS